MTTFILIVLMLLSGMLFAFLFVDYFSKKPPMTFFTNSPAENFVLIGRSGKYEKGFIDSRSGDLDFWLNHDGSVRTLTPGVVPSRPKSFLFRWYGWVWLSLSPSVKVMSFEIDAVRLREDIPPGSDPILNAVVSRKKVIRSIRRNFVRPHVVEDVELSNNNLDFLFRCTWEVRNPVLFALRYNADLQNVEDALSNAVNDFFSSTPVPGERDRPKNIIEFRDHVESSQDSPFNRFILDSVNAVAPTYGLKLCQVVLRNYGLVKAQRDIEEAQAAVQKAKLEGEGVAAKALGDKEAAITLGQGVAEARKLLLEAEAKGALAVATAEGQGWQIILGQLRVSGVKNPEEVIAQLVQERRAKAIGANTSGIVYVEGGSSSSVGIMANPKKP